MNKDELLLTLGAIGGGIAALLGGWDTALIALIIVMGADYATGLILAGVFKRSRKTATGALSSAVGWRGLCKKGVALLIVLVACQLDKVIGSSIIRDTAVIGFIANETISIIENAGLIGVPIPDVILQAIEILNGKNEKKDGESVESQKMPTDK